METSDPNRPEFPEREPLSAPRPNNSFYLNQSTDLFANLPPQTQFTSSEHFFSLSVSGKIEYAEYPDIEALQVKFDVFSGQKWRVARGQATGISQFAHSSATSSRKIIWNFPFNIELDANDAEGWPLLILTCTGSDFLGRHVIKGYGTVRVPTVQGRHTRIVHLYAPRSSSFLVRMIGVLKGKVPELANPLATLAQNMNRDAVKVVAHGKVHVVFNIASNNMSQMGFK